MGADLVVRNGTVVDGLGGPAFPADVVVEGARITAVGRADRIPAERTIDATGKFVCPGFIDVHSHSDFSIHANPTGESTLRQGVTTEIVGQCGFSSAPVTPLSRDGIEGRLRTYAYDGPVTWRSFGEYMDAVAAEGTSMNLGWFVGHNTLRSAVDARGADPGEDALRRMEHFVREAMEAGAFGLTTGLEFEPGRQSLAPEAVRLAKVVGEHGGYYSSHIRNRDAHLLSAVEEFLDVARRSGCRAEISHLNVRHNTGAPEDGWLRAVDMLEDHRRRDLDVMADMTPLRDGIGQMQGILPAWALADGPLRAAEILRDPAGRSRLRTDCDRYWRFIHRGEWDRVRLVTSSEFPDLNGLSFPEIARRRGADAWDCYFDILAAAGERMDSVFLVAQLFTDEHLETMARHPLFNFAVDGYTSRTDGPLAAVSRHRLNFAGMAHYLTHFVRDRRVLPLEEAVHKMTGRPAAHFRLTDRGVVRPGAFADLVVLDLEGLTETWTPERPQSYTTGVEHVLVNGALVISGGEHTGARPGRALRRA